MVQEVLFDPGLVLLDVDGRSGVVRWECGAYRFAYWGAVLQLLAPGVAVPLARIAVRDQAVQFSLGFVAGRTLWLPGDRVVE